MQFSVKRGAKTAQNDTQKRAKITLNDTYALSEKQIQEQIVGYLRMRGWEVSEIRERYAAGQGRYSQPGIPDVYCIKGGRQVWLEVKTRKGRVRPAQVEWHERHRKAGGEVYVVRSLEDALEACDKENPDEVMF